MKKTFALVLAIAMVMGLAAVSFADYKMESISFDGTDVIAFKYDADKNQLQDKGYIEWGKTAYFPIMYTGDVIASDYDQVEKMKVKAKWEMGGDIVESVSIVKKYVETFLNYTAPAGFSAGYYYFVAVQVAAKDTYNDADVVGTLTFNMKKDSDAKIDGVETVIDKTDDLDIDVAFNVKYEYSDWLDSGVDQYSLVDSDEFYVRYDRSYALKFDADVDDDVEFTFGGNQGDSDENEGTFTVDCSGQGKLYVKLTTTANDDIVAANPSANMRFINFNNVKFNRTGEFTYEWEDGAYAYQVVDGKLVDIPSLEYDETDETYYFNTRVLGSYVFSDVELVDAAVAAPAEPVVTAPAEENPATGAAA